MTASLTQVMEDALAFGDWRDSPICPVCGEATTFATLVHCQDVVECPVAAVRRQLPSQRRERGA